MKNASRIAVIAVLSVVLATTACKRETPVEDVGLNTTQETIVNEATLNQVEAPLPPANVAEAVKAAPPPEVSDEVQMRDDADATGLTARLPDDAPSSGNNETQPAE